MTKTPIMFTSEMQVELIRHLADDAHVAAAARVSTLGENIAHQPDLQADTGLINYLMKARHGSPFEHTTFTFFVQAPIFVFREFMRHRIASYNEESGRYRQLQPVFYLPAGDRNLNQTGKPGHYQFHEGTNAQHQLLHDTVRNASSSAYARYEELLEAGIAKEVARMVLPVNIMSSMYVTLNSRSLMNFLSLRVHDADAAYPSHPQSEIEMVAVKMEAFFAEKMPITHAAFIRSGRVTP
jgi:thymidylate synthase (FAD)